MQAPINPIPAISFNLTVKGKTPEPPTQFPRDTDIQRCLGNTDLVYKRKGKLLMATSPQNPVGAPLSNGFIGAIYNAYSNHHRLVLRPDDVWLAIVIAFADYIDNHAEEMRQAFVDHDGKKQLIVASGGSIATADWAGFIAQFSDLINQNTKGGVRDWIEPRFTTTTSKDSLIGRVALMGAMKHYFAYGCMICCGLPSVTLEGTLADWQELRHRVDRLADYGRECKLEDLVWWQQVLAPILDQFVASYQGRVDNDWWQSCAHYIAGGSGPSYMTGWVLAFAPFHKGQWRLAHPDDIAHTGKYGQVETGEFSDSATVEVPVKVNDNGTEYDIMFYAGGIVNSYDKASNTIRPSFDFALLQMPAGTHQDEIDWDEPSGYQLPKRKPVVSKIAAFQGRPLESKIPSHDCTLKARVYDDNRYRCDLCRVSGLTTGYECRRCDFDCCMDCYNKGGEAPNPGFHAY